MKKKNRSQKLISTRRLVLCLTALLLVLMIALSSTVSWIEEVSHVDFDNTSGQQTPAMIGSKILKSDVLSREKIVDTQNNINESDEIATVSLNDFFKASGDMHLSPCYGDGENFYFPIDGGNGFRTGTKDDANVNYLSTTFRLRSINSDTVYWFTKAIAQGTSNILPFVTFKDGNTADSTFTKYLRCSVTIDGATNVYCMDDSTTTGNEKTYRTVENNAITAKTGRNIEEYCYYDEDFQNSNPVGYYKASANKTNKPNQGEGDNLNGNTLFTVNKYNTTTKEGLKTVTVKIWLECPVSEEDNSVADTESDVDISSVNFDFVSAWAKTRRIYLHDATVDEYDTGFDDDHTTTNWLKKDPKAKLYWGLKDDSETTGYKNLGELNRVSGTDWYYLDIPAVYYNRECALFRCDSQWNGGNTHDGEAMKYWDKWATTFPNSFHSEIFTVYSHKYGTWEQENINQLTFIDSAKFTELGLKPKAYLWDSSTEYGTGVNDKVVMNAKWPGDEMTRMYATAGNMDLPTYKLFYTSRFDRGVFDDGVAEIPGVRTRNQLQTQDVWFLNGSTSYVKDYFDMATLKWYTTAELSKVKYTSTVLVNNFNQNGADQDGNNWSHIRMVYYTDGTQGTNNNYFMCRAYIKSPGTYKLMVYDGTKHYGKPDGWGNWGENYEETMRNIDDITGGSKKYKDGYVVDINITQQDINDSGNGIFRFFFRQDSKKFEWKRGEDSRDNN